MSSQSSGSPDGTQLAKALAHPMRLRILQQLETGPATPKDLALQLDVPLENLSYHVRVLRDLGQIEVESREIMGPRIQHRYRLAERRPKLTAEVWSGLPAHVREATAATVFSSIVEVAGDALIHGGVQRDDALMIRRPMMLDEQGFREVSELLHEFMEEIDGIERESAQRIAEGAEAIPALVVAMLLETGGRHHGPAPHDPGTSRNHGTPCGGRRRRDTP